MSNRKISQLSKVIQEVTQPTRTKKKCRSGGDGSDFLSPILANTPIKKIGWRRRVKGLKNTTSGKNKKSSFFDSYAKNGSKTGKKRKLGKSTRTVGSTESTSIVLKSARNSYLKKYNLTQKLKKNESVAPLPGQKKISSRRSKEVVSFVDPKRCRMKSFDRISKITVSCQNSTANNSPAVQAIKSSRNMLKSQLRSTSNIKKQLFEGKADKDNSEILSQNQTLKTPNKHQGGIRRLNSELHSPKDCSEEIISKFLIFSRSERKSIKRRKNKHSFITKSAYRGAKVKQGSQEPRRRLSKLEEALLNLSAQKPSRRQTHRGDDHRKHKTCTSNIHIDYKSTSTSSGCFNPQRKGSNFLANSYKNLKIFHTIDPTRDSRVFQEVSQRSENAQNLDKTCIYEKEVVITDLRGILNSKPILLPGSSGDHNSPISVIDGCQEYQKRSKKASKKRLKGSKKKWCFQRKISNAYPSGKHKLQDSRSYAWIKGLYKDGHRKKKKKRVLNQTANLGNTSHIRHSGVNERKRSGAKRRKNINSTACVGFKAKERSSGELLRNSRGSSCRNNRGKGGGFWSDTSPIMKNISRENKRKLKKVVKTAKNGNRKIIKIERKDRTKMQVDPGSSLKKILSHSKEHISRKSGSKKRKKAKNRSSGIHVPKLKFEISRKDEVKRSQRKARFTKEMAKKRVNNFLPKFMRKKNDQWKFWIDRFKSFTNGKNRGSGHAKRRQKAKVQKEDRNLAKKGEKDVLKKRVEFSAGEVPAGRKWTREASENSWWALREGSEASFRCSGVPGSKKRHRLIDSIYEREMIKKEDEGYYKGLTESQIKVVDNIYLSG